MTIVGKKSAKTALAKTAALMTEVKAAPDAVVETDIKTAPVPAKKPEDGKKAGKTSASSKKTSEAKKGPKTSVTIEYEGKQVLAKDVIAEASRVFGKANKGVEIKTLDIYIKPEEHAAYYVVNGVGSEDYKVLL